jgi:hypothetical protein
MSGGGHWGDIALRFSGSNGIGASAKANASSGASTVSLTTSQPDSAIVCFCLDFNGGSGASRVWETINSVTPTAGNGYEQAYTLDTGNYTIYAAYWPDAGAAGAKTVGLSAPTGMAFSVIAVEVLGIPPVFTRNVLASQAVMRAAVW